MIVFAFDRDWTVDVNPHPRHDAVPLEWVRYLAHETDHAVYAIGNQRLAEEAAIPGVVDVVGRHDDDWDRWLGAKRPDGRYERFPVRRERLSLIADLHPDADGYVVVDDLDLSDVDGWDHYHAWDFIPAVERGDVHADLPWVREPVSDGEHVDGTRSGPMSYTDLSSFLEEHDDAPAYELTYADDGERRTRLCYAIRIIQRTVKRPAAAVAVTCTPVSPGADSFTARVDSIERITTADPPASLFTAGADSPSELSTGLVRLANADPSEVSLSMLLSTLEAVENGSFDQRQTLNAVRHVAEARPAECRPLIPVLRSLLQTEATPAVEVLAPLRVLSQEVPGDVAPAAQEIARFLQVDDEDARREAARCLAGIAEDAPGDTVGAIPSLVALLADRGSGLEYAAYALSRVAQARPEAVQPFTETLREAIVDESLSDYTRTVTISALGRVVGDSPSEAVDIVDDLVELLDAENSMLKNNAVGLIGDVALLHSDTVEPHVDVIAALLTVDDDYTRINASCALARVAEDFPESVEHLTPQFLRLLADSEAVVRKNACWALGHLRAPDTEAALEDRLCTESDPEVHARAEWALDQIQG